MKYYSEIIKEFYETEKACLEAEKAYNAELRLKEEEARRKMARKAELAKKVEEARVAMDKAKKNYDELLAEYCKDYGSYHYNVEAPLSLNDILGSFFKY